MGRFASQWRSWRASITAHKAQLSLSFRVTIAALLGFGLSRLLHVPLPLWTVLTSVILTQASFGRSLKATLDYFAGTLAGAVYAGGVAALFPTTNDLHLAGVLALSVAPLAALGAFNRSFTVATFTGVLVLLLPGASHMSAVQTAFDRVLEVGVGGAAALAVSLLVLPTRAHSLTVEAAVRMLNLAAESLTVWAASCEGTTDPAEVRRIQDRMGQAAIQLDAAFAEARHERIGFLATGPDCELLSRTILRLRHDLIMLGRAGAVLPAAQLRARLGPTLARVAQTAADYLCRSAKALTHASGPPSGLAVKSALDDFAEAFASARSEGLARDLSAEAVERLYTLGFAFEQMGRNLGDLERCVKDVAHSQ